LQGHSVVIIDLQMLLVYDHVITLDSEVRSCRPNVLILSILNIYADRQDLDVSQFHICLLRRCPVLEDAQADHDVMTSLQITMAAAQSSLLDKPICCSSHVHVRRPSMLGSLNKHTDEHHLRQL
jgi:hypothetical protein